MTDSFRPYSWDHLLVFAVILFMALVLFLNLVRIRQMKDDRWVRYPLASLLIVNAVATWAYFAYEGYMILPLQFCDLALFFTVWALFGGGRFVKEFAFFWGLAGSSQAVATPDLDHGFPSYEWIAFFLNHSGILLAALYLAVRKSLQLTNLSVWRVWIATNLYILIAGLANRVLSTNFGYLVFRPEDPSLLDYLGPWPFYILWADGLALVFYFLLLGFAHLLDIFGRKTGQSPHGTVPFTFI